MSYIDMVRYQYIYIYISLGCNMIIEKKQSLLTEEDRKKKFIYIGIDLLESKHR